MSHQLWHIKAWFCVSLLGLLLSGCAQFPRTDAQTPNQPGKITERGLIITMESVFFDFDSAKLDAKARETIADLAKLLKQEPDSHYIIGIDGYTDVIGKEDYNLNLSKLRADTVKAAFIAQGIAPQRLDAKGFGQADPISDNTTWQGRQQNRRVEILILQPSDIQRQDDV